MTPEEISAIADAVRGALETARPLPPKKLFTAQETAEITGLPKSLFEEEWSHERLPSVKIGRYRRVTEEQIDFVIEVYKVTPKTGPFAERWRAKQKAAARAA